MLDSFFGFIDCLIPSRKPVTTPKDEWVSHKLYLGHDIGSGPFQGTVTDEQMAKFVAEVVSNYVSFFTISTVTGMHQNKTETTTIIEVLSPDGVGFNLARVGKIYRQQFCQESVMYTRTAIDHVDFI